MQRSHASPAEGRPSRPDAKGDAINQSAVLLPSEAGTTSPARAGGLRRGPGSAPFERGGTDRMALNRDFIGRSFPPSEPYEVSRVKIREFAQAIGDPNPIYRDPEAAKAAGHPDVIAPPTFPIVVSLGNPALADPELGLNYAMVVHGEQRFEYTRPVRAGDVLVTTSTITDIKAIGNNEKMVVETEITTVEGEPVCKGYNTIVERGA
jgi:acyl dehydratase